MKRARTAAVAIGSSFLVGVLATPASAGITVYEYLNYGGGTRYYDYSDCNYGDNKFSNGHTMEIGALSAKSYASSTMTYYFYWGVSQNCINRNPTGWERRLYPGQSFSGTNFHGHFKA